MWNPFKKKEEEEEEEVKHCHEYKIINSHNEKMINMTTDWDYFENKNKRTVDIAPCWYTHILFRCDCGHWYKSKIEGKWTKEDIRKIEKG